MKKKLINSDLLRSCCVAASRSEPNCAKAATSLYWASSSFMLPATCFMDLVWAADPTRDTDRPTLIAGRIPGVPVHYINNQCWACGSGLDPDLMGSLDPYPDPQSGSRRAKMTHKRRKMLRNIMF
jgi:hypothetical protein